MTPLRPFFPQRINNLDGARVAIEELAKRYNDLLKSQTASAGATVTEDDFVFSDTAIGDVSIAKHGLAPKSPGDPTKYLDGLGGYSVPAGSTGTSTAAGIDFAETFLLMGS